MPGGVNFGISTCSSTGVDEGRSRNLLAIKIQGTNSVYSAEGGEKSLLCDPGSESRLIGG